MSMATFSTEYASDFTALLQQDRVDAIRTNLNQTNRLGETSGLGARFFFDLTRPYFSTSRRVLVETRLGVREICRRASSSRQELQTQERRAKTRTVKRKTAPRVFRILPARRSLAAYSRRETSTALGMPCSRKSTAKRTLEKEKTARLHGFYLCATYRATQIWPRDWMGQWYSR